MVNKYVPLVCFVAFVGKSLLMGSNIVDGALIGILGTLAFFYEYTNFKKDKADILGELDAVKQQLEFLKQENSNNKNYLTSLKMGARTFSGGTPK